MKGRTPSAPTVTAGIGVPLLPQTVSGEEFDSLSCSPGSEAMEYTQPGPPVSGVVVTTSPVLRLAVAAYLARFKGQSRLHTESDFAGLPDLV